MEFLKIAGKALFLLAMVGLMAAPFVMEFLSFRRDTEKKISYKRFRLLVYTGVYIIAVTVALTFWEGLVQWLEAWQPIQWLVKWLALDGRAVYCAKVLAAIVLNFLIGVLYRLLGRFVRIGLQKKDLTTPAGKGQAFGWRQKAERAVIRFFHTETWFFVGTVLRYLSIALSVAYGLLFAAYQIPALFAADWIPYKGITLLFDGGYRYPTITLLGLWAMVFFLEGIRRVEAECPALLAKEGLETAETAVDLDGIDEALREQFRDAFACALALDEEEASAEGERSATAAKHHPLTEDIARAVENDQRNPQPRREVYLHGTDRLVEEEKSLLLSGSLFSGFAPYFLRYLSAVVTRGDNVVFVCNTDAQIDAVHDFLVQGFSEIFSLYCKDFSGDPVDFDDPIWRIVKVHGAGENALEDAGGDNNILVTSLRYLSSAAFEEKHGDFITRIDTVVFPETLETVNLYNRQLAMFHTLLRHMTRRNAITSRNEEAGSFFRVRYLSRQVRYFCFDDTRVPGLDRVLKNLLAVDFLSVDTMRYPARTMVRCYRLEGAGDGTQPVQLLQTEELLGTVMNMALLCLAKGAGSVTVFAENIPYANFLETIAANLGDVSFHVDPRGLRLNKPHYNPDNYTVVLALDTGDNLPETVRKYASLCPDRRTLLVILSRPYLLRDAYLADLPSLWQKRQLQRIPVKTGTERDVAQRILVQANAGGIGQTEVFRLASMAPGYETFVKERDISSLLRAVLAEYGLPQEDRMDLFRYFTFSSEQTFDAHGKYREDVRIMLRRMGKLFDRINGRDMVVMKTGEADIPLPLPRCRMTQNYIALQNLLHDGCLYTIQSLDTAEGCLYARHAVGGKNDAVYRYLQDREYRVECGPDQVTYTFPVRHMALGRQQDGIAVDDVFVSVFTAPMEVLTYGYFDVDPRTLDDTGACRYHSITDPENEVLAKQTYRRYGRMTAPRYSADSILKDTELNACETDARMMTIRLCGAFGEDSHRTARLAAVMLTEMLRAMFPSVADSLVVCPILPEVPYDPETPAILQKQPRCILTGEHAFWQPGDLTLCILEDCATDLGVVSVLMSDGDNILHTLFEPVYDYLHRYMEGNEKSRYLYFGLDHEPACFDFASLYKLACLCGGDRQPMRFVDIDSLAVCETCDFCGKRYPAGEGIVTLADGRRMCDGCAGGLADNSRRALRSTLDSARLYLESTYRIRLEEDVDVCFASTAEILQAIRQSPESMRRGADVPLRSYVDMEGKLHAECTIPAVNLAELLVRELTHTWQRRLLPHLSEELAEGHIALVAVQYLRFRNQQTLAQSRTHYYESTAALSGVGYRRLVKALLQHPQYQNDPFQYLLETAGDSQTEKRERPAPRLLTEGALGKPYTAAAPDRAAEGEISYFYYDRLPAALRELYDRLLTGIRTHAPEVTGVNCTIDELTKVSHSISYDHPELFWYKSCALRGGDALLYYGASPAEAAALQKRIDEAVPQFLAGIEPTMSAYDVALRIHTRIIAMVDYDTIALQKQKEAGGPADDRIDELRTICGVFLKGKAVCEGYARAVQYLLQKCGVECAEAVGYIHMDNGDDGQAHAWNILRVDGDYYYLDTTWDDSSNTIQTVKRTEMGFDYFCITTEELTRTRDTRLCPVEMPLCQAVRANYFHHNSLVLSGWEPERLKEIARWAAENRLGGMTCKCADRAVYDQVQQRLCQAGPDSTEVLKQAARQDRRIRTDMYAYACDKNMLTITLYFRCKE